MITNQEWKSSTEDGARIGRMKDGRTRLKYKVENVVDLETELILAAEVCAGGQGNTLTVEDTVVAAQTNVAQGDADCESQEVVRTRVITAQRLSIACSTKVMCGPTSPSNDARSVASGRGNRVKFNRHIAATSGTHVGLVGTDCSG